MISFPKTLPASGYGNVKFTLEDEKGMGIFLYFHFFISDRL